MWKNKKKFKGQFFWGNYEFNKAGIRFFNLKNIRTGRETKSYTSPNAAKKDGWYKV